MMMITMTTKNIGRKTKMNTIKNKSACERNRRLREKTAAARLATKPIAKKPVATKKATGITISKKPAATETSLNI